MFSGKTTFQYYLLVRLLQLKQVVLFSLDGNVFYLFYLNEVHTISKEMDTPHRIAVSLPTPISSSNVFIWSLFDIEERKVPQVFLVPRPCFPVQTASPDPIRYRTWDKEGLPLLTGLPLWTRDELAQGLQYQHEYRSLLDALHKLYGSTSPNPRDPLSALCSDQSANHAISHRILALSPVDQGPLVAVRWNVNFKSDWVARNVIRKLGEAEDIVISRQINYFRSIPEARGLAQRLLEPLAHRYIANAAYGF